MRLISPQGIGRYLALLHTCLHGANSGLISSSHYVPQMPATVNAHLNIHGSQIETASWDFLSITKRSGRMIKMQIN